MRGCRKASQYQNPRPSRCCSRSTKPSAISLVPLLPHSRCRWKFLQMRPRSVRSCYSATSNWTLTDDNTAFMAAQIHYSPSQILVRVWQRPCKWFTPFLHHEPRSKQSGGKVADSRQKILNSPKEMNAVCTKVVLLLFPRVSPFAPSIFSEVTPRNVLHWQPHIIWHVLALVTSQNMPRTCQVTCYVRLQAGLGGC
jgi:hypothetical protein